MARTKVTLAPWFAEDRDELLNVVRAADQPLEAAKVAQLAMTTRRAKPGEISAILEEFVASGVLRVFPPLTVKGKARYWDRDPKAIGQSVILELVQGAPEPISAKEVKQLVQLPFKLSEPEIASLLSNFVHSGALEEIPAKTAKGGLRYWKYDAVEFGRRCLLAQLQAKGPQSKSKLKGWVKWLNDARFQQVVERLTLSREIYAHPAIGSSRSIRFGHRPPAPESYLKDVGDRLAKIVEKLRHAEVPPDEIRRAVVQIVESAGLALGAIPALKGDDAPVHHAGAVDLVALMRRIEPGADREALVTARVLRHAAKLDKADFDALVLQLARQGRISLHEHDFASSLSEDERESLVTDGQGHYYVGMALRLGAGES